MDLLRGFLPWFFIRPKVIRLICRCGDLRIRGGIRRHTGQPGRRLLSFMRMNLMDTTYPVDHDVDIIFCRNVLIYFDKATQNKVVDRLCGHLRPGGYLMVGHSESMVHSVVPGMKQVQPTIFRV